MSASDPIWATGGEISPGQKKCSWTFPESCWRVEETKPVDVFDQPDFINQVVLLETDIAPHGLLKILRGIESDMGRVRDVPKGPRVIDLDVLLYGSEIIDTGDLKIPHPEIVRRLFVLKHLLEMSPGLKDPVTGTPYREVYYAALKKHQ